MVFKDYYKILSLETNRVSSEKIRNAYRMAAKKYHPDLNVGDKLSEEKIKDINEAYRVLSDSTAKRKYDRMWVNNVARKNKRKIEKGNEKVADSVFTEFFNMFFGDISNNIKEDSKLKKDKKPIKGENIETTIDAEIEEAFYGLNKKISMKSTDGSVKNFDVTIPQGIRDGEKIRLIGQGKEGTDGGKNGDLFIKINIKDNKKFKLKGKDLYTDLFLTPWEAALGTRVQLQSIDDTAQVYIPEGVQTGEILRIPGKGYKDGQGGRGDLIAEVKVMVPKSLSSEEKNLFEKMNKISKFNPRK